MERSPSQELRDIREYTNDPDAYAAELERRWTGLLSYRYIGVSIPSMNTGPADPTVKVRHDMRNATGGLLAAPLSITAPQGSVDADLVAVPNPVIHSCMILDPARDVTRLAIAGGQILHRGPQHVALEAAAVDAAAELVGTDLLQMRAWHVMFLARGKIGPFRIEAEAMRGADDQVGVVLAMYDEGNGNRRVTSANAAFVVGR
jgi:hypothetical protein